MASDIKVSLGLPTETAKGDSRFAGIGGPSLPIEATLGLPIMVKKQLIYLLSSMSNDNVIMAMAYELTGTDCSI